jgi:hypothetical protein
MDPMCARKGLTPRQSDRINGNSFVDGRHRLGKHKCDSKQNKARVRVVR